MSLNFSGSVSPRAHCRRWSPLTLLEADIVGQEIVQIKPRLRSEWVLNQVEYGTERGQFPPFHELNFNDCSFLSCVIVFIPHCVRQETFLPIVFLPALIPNSNELIYGI